MDTLIVIPNQNLFRVADKNTTFADAFKLADNVLYSGVRGVTDLMVMPGLINLDFADVRSVMSEMGKAMMGTGEAEGENRSTEAAEAAIANPLLDNVSMKGARGVLINITGGSDMTLFEVDTAANRIREEVDPDANIIFGSTFDEELKGKMRVSVVATGIDASSQEASTKTQARKSARDSFAETPPAQAETRRANAPSTNPSWFVPAESEAEVEQSTLSLQQETEESQAEESGGSGETFIAPKPAEPRMHPFSGAPSFNQNEEDEQVNRIFSPARSAFFEADKLDIKKPKTRGGFFGIGAKRPEQERVEPQVRPEEEKVLEDALTNSAAEKGPIAQPSFPREDIFDIPAFLRRKSS